MASDSQPDTLPPSQTDTVAAGGRGAEHARHLDGLDPAPRRSEFLFPRTGTDDVEVAYLAGNSLGLQSTRSRAVVDELLTDWARFGVEGHVEAAKPWVSYHELLRAPAATLVGALPSEVVAMNSLTVNLHLLMLSFYRPSATRNAIVVEDTCFPSDSYAVRSQALLHGLNPDEVVIRLQPRPGEPGLRNEDVIDFLAREGQRVALVMLGAVNYYSGELLDIPTITAAGHAAGAVVGWDLAHAVGNVEVQLHDWGVDWAVWCTYKYLNSGPGAVAGAFVHERHHQTDLPKLQGWWSTDPAVRFQMRPTVDPVAGADSWQLSNPPILAMAPVLASLEMFAEVGMDTLRARSRRLTAYLERLLDTVPAAAQVITPRDPDRRGAQLSVRITGRSAREVAAALAARGVVADAREPDVVRFAPAPLYVSYHDCWRAVAALGEVLSDV